jgi:hypothetical protein
MLWLAKDSIFSPSALSIPSNSLRQPFLPSKFSTLVRSEFDQQSSADNVTNSALHLRCAPYERRCLSRSPKYFDKETYAHFSVAVIQLRGRNSP